MKSSSEINNFCKFNSKVKCNFALLCKKNISALDQAKIFKHLFYNFELESLEQGKRDFSLFQVELKSYQKFIDILYKNKLHYLVKIKIAREIYENKVFSIFTIKDQILQSCENDLFLFEILASQNLQKLKKIKTKFFSNDASIGKYLGFPRCCVDKFVKVDITEYNYLCNLKTLTSFDKFFCPLLHPPESIFRVTTVFACKLDCRKLIKKTQELNDLKIIKNIFSF